MALKIEATENVTVEQIEAMEKELQTKRANLEFANLQTSGIEEFHKSASEAHTVEEIYKVCSNFKWRVEKIRRVLGTKNPQETRGRPAKQAKHK